MAVGKEIRTKIKSIKNTQKITGAMQMVAASKMRKSQEQMQSTRPYAQLILRLASHLSQANIDFEHAYLTVREVKRVGIIVVSSDRGLCGGLNNNLFKQLTAFMSKCSQSNIGVDVVSIGNKANAFFNRFGGNVIAAVNGLGDVPSMTQLLGAINVMLKAYREESIDEVHIFTNVFVNTMVQKPSTLMLLPLKTEAFFSIQENDEDAPELLTHGGWDYIYDTKPEKLIDLVLNRYLESIIYQSVVENIACEMAARMIAMQAATDNAEALVDGLQLVYNKARQAAITQELTEIVSGASAV